MKAPWVVKLGGDVARAGEGLRALARELAAEVRAGRRIVVVHGGGPQASELMKRLSLEPRFAGGRRITDEPTLLAVRMAIAGEVGTALAGALSAEGVEALATTGISANLVRATRRPPRVIAGAGSAPVDLGLVGDVTDVRCDRIEALLDAGFTPVLGCLAGDGAGGVLNINADVVSVELARALGAEALLAISNVPGVLTDPGNPGSRLARLDRAGARARIADGTIGGGMVAKVDEALRALDLGVPRVIITGPPGPGLLESSVDGSGGAGTEIVESAG